MGTPSTVRVPGSTPPARSRSSICRRILWETPSMKMLDCSQRPDQAGAKKRGGGKIGMESRYLDEVVAEGEQGVERAGTEIRDGELRAEARGVESVRGREPGGRRGGREENNIT